METKRLEKYRRRLRSRMPLIGGWLRRKAVEALMKDGSSEAARALAKAVNLSNDGQARDEMLAALRFLTNQRGIDAVCEDWASTRYTALAQLIVTRGWVASAPVGLRVLSALKAGRLEAVTEGGAEVVEPLLQACEDADPTITRRAHECLARLQNPDAVDAVCARWAAKREVLLAKNVAEAGYVARWPVEMRVLSALKAGRLEVVTESGAEVVEPLLQACKDSDVEIAQQAREALCRLVIEHDLPTAREAALDAQYAPHKPHERALFYFLTEQWDKYESLDFDYSLLRAAYEAGDEKLRLRIGERAQRAGRVEWVEVAASGLLGRRLGGMTDREWEVTMEVLGGSGRWAEMWRLAQEAPARWSARLLQRVSSVDWVPEGDGERAGYKELSLLAGRWTEAWLGSLTQGSMVLEGQTSLVNCLASSPDGRVLASGESSDKTVRLWSLPDGAPLKTLKGHTDYVNCLAISPDGRALASGSRDNTVRLWSLPDGALLKTLEGHRSGITCLATSQDMRMLASGSGDNTVQLWSLPDGMPLKTLTGHTSAVRCLNISHDKQILASGSVDKTVRLWSLPDGAPLSTLKGHRDSVCCLAISPDGRMLASGSGDNTVRLWSLPDGAPLNMLNGHTNTVFCLAISPDGQILASGSADDRVQLWSLPDGAPLNTLKGHRDSVCCLAISPDGRMLASGSQDNTVRLWTFPYGILLRALRGHIGSVYGLAFSPDGQVLVSGGRDLTVRLWILDPFSHLPIGQMSPKDLAWVREALRDGNLSAEERNCLEFIAALIQWRQRFEIILAEEPRQIAVGEFDIVIQG